MAWGNPGTLRIKHSELIKYEIASFTVSTSNFPPFPMKSMGKLRPKAVEVREVLKRCLFRVGRAVSNLHSDLISSRESEPHIPDTAGYRRSQNGITLLYFPRVVFNGIWLRNRVGLDSGRKLGVKV